MSVLDYFSDPRVLEIEDFLRHRLRGHPMFYKLMAVATVLHADKNGDYARHKAPLANFTQVQDRYGVDPIHGLLTRMSDKESRFEGWVQDFVHEGSAEFAVKDEALVDVLVDRANYSILFACLLHELKWWTLDLEESSSAKTGPTEHQSVSVTVSVPTATLPAESIDQMCGDIKRMAEAGL